MKIFSKHISPLFLFSSLPLFYALFVMYPPIDIFYSDSGGRSTLVIVSVIFGGVLVCRTVASYLSNRSNDSKERERLKRLVKQKRAEREEKLQKLKSIHKLDENAKLITELSVDELVEKLQSKKLTAHDVLSAYIAKAVEATEKFNCVTEFIPQAEQWAQELDALPNPKGPLHGLPICIKDDIGIEGMDATLGFAKKLYNPSSESAVLVKVLISLGGIPFCKTNVPQGLFSYGSDNPVWGTTVNCLRQSFSPGGSSSGSACLIGAGASPFGLGTDIGGSLRIPAHFNGISSIKPTFQRLSGKGVVQSIPKCVGLIAVPGIMAKKAKTVATVFKSVVTDCQQNNLDPMAVPIQFDNQLFSSKKKLRVGYYTNLPLFPLLGDTEKTILKAKCDLESLGHELVPFTLPNDYEILKVCFDLLTADFGNHSYLSQMFKHETIAETVLYTAYLCGMSLWSRKLFKFLGSLPFLPGYSSRVKLVLSTSLDVRESYQLWNTMDQGRKFKEDILNRMQELQLDLILCPVFPFPACRLSDTVISAATIYTFVYNLMDFPTGVIPYGTESGKNIENYDDQGDAVLKMAKQGIKASIGMPIGIQFVARPFKEELVLRAMIDLENYSEQNNK